MLHVIAYDIGTTGVKTGLISVGETVELVADAYQGYDLYILENGGAEQDARPVVERHVRNDPEPDEKKSGAARKNRRDFLLFPDAGASSSGQGRECSRRPRTTWITGAKGNEGCRGWHPDPRGKSKC